jgi:hypothetical protein
MRHAELGKMEAIRSFDASVDTQLTTRRYIPEDRTLHDHSCESLKSYTSSICGRHLEQLECIEFGVLTVMVTNSTIFWDATLCTREYIHRHLGGTYCLHLQSWKISYTSSQQEAGDIQSYRLHGFIPWDSTLHSHRCEKLKCHTFHSQLEHQVTSYHDNI